MAGTYARSTQTLVIGGGPAGYVAAIRLGQLGRSTILVERRELGGECLNRGCIPSKALIHAAGEFARVRAFTGDSALGIRVEAPRLDLAQTVRWKDGIVSRLTGGVAGLLRKNKVRVLHGWARILDGKTVEVTPAGEDGAALRIACEHLLLATGSQAEALPGLPFGGRVVSSTEALAPRTLPEHLAVVGAGYIGLELGTAYRNLGARVSVVERLDRVLPGYDEELTRPVAAALERLGVALHLGCSVQGMDGERLRIRDGAGVESGIDADRVLVAVGRRPRTEGFGLEDLMLDRDGRAVRIDERCRTSMRNVWAIGDLTGEPMLAHRAMAQGAMVAELIAGQRRRFAPAAIPAVCFTDPEVVCAGLTPPQAAAAGLDCLSAAFPFAANGRAMTLESDSGFVRVVARRADHAIVGWQAVGRGVSELAAVFGHALEMGERLEDAAATIHAHPTLGEAVQEAALRALGQALHV